MPLLEHCGAQLLAKLLTNVRNALNIDLNHVFACSDNTIVLHWLDGSPKWFKISVGNRVSAICQPEHGDMCLRRQTPLIVLLRSPTQGANCLWKGPPWLQMEPLQLPPQPLSSPVSTWSSRDATLPVRPLLTGLRTSTVSTLNFFESPLGSFASCCQSQGTQDQSFHDSYSVSFCN